MIAVGIQKSRSIYHRQNDLNKTISNKKQSKTRFPKITFQTI